MRRFLNADDWIITVKRKKGWMKKGRKKILNNNEAECMVLVGPFQRCDTMRCDRYRSEAYKISYQPDEMATFNRQTTVWRTPKKSKKYYYIAFLDSLVTVDDSQPYHHHLLFILLVTNLLNARLFRIFLPYSACILIPYPYQKWADERWCMCNECRMKSSPLL